MDMCLQRSSTPVLGPLWVSKGEGFSPKGVREFLTGLISYTKLKLKEAKSYQQQVKRTLQTCMVHTCQHYRHAWCIHVNITDMHGAYMSTLQTCMVHTCQHNRHAWCIHVNITDLHGAYMSTLQTCMVHTCQHYRHAWCIHVNITDMYGAYMSTLQTCMVHTCEHYIHAWCIHVNITDMHGAYMPTLQTCMVHTCQHYRHAWCIHVNITDMHGAYMSTLPVLGGKYKIFHGPAFLLFGQNILLLKTKNIHSKIDIFFAHETILASK